MKILHISSAKTFGGGERHLVDLCRELSCRGHEVHVVLRPSNQWQSKLDFLPPENIFHSSIRNAFRIFSAKRIARYVRERGIEVVHAHTGRDYIPASLVCRMSKGVKFVLTRHVLFPLKPFNRVALRNLSKAIAVSGAVARNLRDIFPVEKIACIPNGIAAPDADPATRLPNREEFRFFHEIPFDAPVVGTIGELKPLKGQRDFVLAANELAGANPDVRFVVVGSDNSATGEFRRELKRLVKVFGIEDRFLFLDWVEDLSPLFAALDVFVSPSHSESFGLAILEAMACGVPIVATETEGAKELLGRRSGGLIVPVGEPLKLAEAIRELIGNPEKRNALAESARTSALENFSLTAMVDATEAVYRSP
ncbi:MAG: glycosyltransferase family 4 protein [Acidobacteria bacterium]|nr:glycosyltransferase family 4 protein [Acidobacteriota bacterium]